MKYLAAMVGLLTVGAPLQAAVAHPPSAIHALVLPIGAAPGFENKHVIDDGRDLLPKGITIKMSPEMSLKYRTMVAYLGQGSEVHIVGSNERLIVFDPTHSDIIVAVNFRPAQYIGPNINPVSVAFRGEALDEMLRRLQPYLTGGEAESAFVEWTKVLDAAKGVVGPFTSLRAPPFIQPTK